LFIPVWKKQRAPAAIILGRRDDSATRLADVRSSSPATSPPRTTCFDIFSPPPGDSDVISHVDRLSSNETKIAPRSVRIAVGASGRSATVCMVASRVGGSNLTLPKCRSLSTSPWDLEGKPAVGENIRHHTALVEFARRYNETWLVARHGYRTPAQVRADQRRLDQDAVDDLQLAA
jgi:hypothetical protein